MSDTPAGRGTRVLIVGASIGGPALAHCLHHYGFDVTVIERATELRPGGQAVDFRGVGYDVLRYMELFDAVWQARTRTEKLIYVTADGKEFATQRADDFGGNGFIAPLEILRGDLAAVFYNATRDKVNYVFGEQVAELHQDATGVDVTFQSGAQDRFDLVVGADGLHSGIRSLVFGPEANFVKYQGTSIGFFSCPNYLHLDSVMVAYNEIGMGGGLRAIQDNDRASALFAFQGDNTEYRLSREEQKARVRERVQSSSWIETSRMLDEMDASEDFYLDSVSVVEMDRWSKGRVVLLGDSAHCASPASGQGTNLAVVGAYILAGELALARGDHQRAFANYERHLRPWVLENQKEGKSNVKFLTPRNRLDVALLYGVQWLLPKLPGRTWLMTQIINKNVQAIEPPNYDRLLPRQTTTT